MNQPLQEFDFLVEITRDGSPTLRFKNLNQNTVSYDESMHHSAGAAAETWYIYGSVLSQVLKSLSESERSQLQTTVVGLGLGYIEMVWALLNLKYSSNSKVKFDSLIGSLDSFEISGELKAEFTSWIHNLNSSTSFIYDLAFEKLTESYENENENENENNLGSVEKSDLQKTLSAQLNHHFKIHGDILKIKEDTKWNIICFDAFSKKTSEQIWTEDFLNHYFLNHCAKDCVLTTYACTSDLKRILKKHDFTILKRPGFSGKRDSTLAVRGKYQSFF